MPSHNWDNSFKMYMGGHGKGQGSNQIFAKLCYHSSSTVNLGSFSCDAMKVKK